MSSGGLSSNSISNNSNTTNITPTGFFPQTTAGNGLANQQQQQQQQLQLPQQQTLPWNDMNTNNNTIVLQYYDPSTGNIMHCYQQPQQQMMMPSQNNSGQQQSRGYNFTSPSTNINVSGYTIMQQPPPPPPPPPPSNMTSANAPHVFQQQQQQNQYQNVNQNFQNLDSNQQQIRSHNMYDKNSGHRNDNSGRNVRSFTNNNNNNNDRFDRNNNRGRSGLNGRGNGNNQPMHQRNNVENQRSYKRGRDQNYDSQYKRPKNFENNLFLPYNQQQHLPQPEQKQQQQQYTCEPCTMSFDTQIAYENHVQSHIKCSVCEFYGIPKVVNGHYAKSHGKFSTNGFKTIPITIPGCKPQKFRICVGNHPDDIAKWIADRKKKFPRQNTTTLINNDMANSNRNTNSSVINANPIDSNHLSRDGCVPATSIMPQNTNITASTMELKVDTTKEQPSLTTIGISSLLAGYESDSSKTSDDEEGEVVEAKVEVTKKEITNIVKENSNNDGQEDTNDSSTCFVVDEVNTTVTTKESRTTHATEAQLVDQDNDGSIQPTNHKTKICRFFARNGTCRHGNNCTFLHDTGTENTIGSGNVHKMNALDNNNNNNNNNNGTTGSILFPSNEKISLLKSSSSHREPSLLRKLLNEDIRRERTLTIKLLKYIVQMNFFQSSNTTTTTNNTTPENQNENQNQTSLLPPT